MKKIIILCKLTTLAALFLVGCSDHNRSVDSMLQKEVKIEQTEVMDSQVKVYSNYSNGDGYVVKAKGRDKWIATQASIISEHPVALIETSNKQLLEGRVTAYNVEQNIAIVHIRNSAEVTATNEATAWDKPVIDKLLKQQQELTYKERLALLDAFAEVEKPIIYSQERLEAYDKNTFTYNPTLIEQFIYKFQQQYEQYLQNGEKEMISEYIGSDLLLDKIEKSYSTEKAIAQFTKVQVNSITLADFQYIVGVELEVNENKQKKNIDATYKLIEVDGQFKMISIQLDEK
ncbi:hypothetical protein [Lysinibacillus sp. 54212]|uniref:hypothetical protein n=1 Tax=Lysinibacillus sp. 54212 TaxID=3119829 RepID=UPI002FC667A4